SQTSPRASSSAFSCPGLKTSGQLSMAQVLAGKPLLPYPSPSGSVHGSQRSPSPSRSLSAWSALGTAGQLSWSAHFPSLSASFSASWGHGSQASPNPSPSTSCWPGLAIEGQLSTAQVDGATLA